MGKVWREIADPSTHSDFMSTHNEAGIPVTPSADQLIEKWVYFAEICDFTFQFVSLDQVRECIGYFERKTHQSTRSKHPPHEHYWHPWYCKLPKGLTRKNKRRKVLKCLYKILERWA